MGDGNVLVFMHGLYLAVCYHKTVKKGCRQTLQGNSDRSLRFLLKKKENGVNGNLSSLAEPTVVRSLRPACSDRTAKVDRHLSTQETWT